MKAAFYTLGCKVNQNETGALAQLFYENGFEPAAEGESADVYVVNSCTVTSGGDKKSRQWLRRAKRHNPDAVMVLMGCFPQAFPEQAAAVEEADIIIGSRSRRKVLDYVFRFMNDKKRIIDIAPHTRDERYEELPMERLEGHTRAFMKIEDGCNRHCAYCVIPRARGNVRSRSEESILEELAALVHSGYSEVVFAGINLSSYGMDTHTDLGRIVEKAAQVPGIRRIRLGSLEPDLITDDMIARMAAVPEFCPQFHLALQSGCDATLRRMRRVYTTAQYTDVVERLRKAFPNATFTTDMIVGFPGETEEELQKSIAYVSEIGFLKVHVFGYSRRAGTPAYDMPDQIDEAEKNRRVHLLQTSADQVRADIIARMEGSRAQVLLETPVSGTLFTGYTCEYVPVLVRAPAHHKGEIVNVILGKFDGSRCATQLCE